MNTSLWVAGKMAEGLGVDPPLAESLSTDFQAAIQQDPSLRPRLADTAERRELDSLMDTKDALSATQQQQKEELRAVVLAQRLGAAGLLGEAVS